MFFPFFIGFKDEVEQQHKKKSVAEASWVPDWQGWKGCPFPSPDSLFHLFFPLQSQVPG